MSDYPKVIPEITIEKEFVGIYSQWTGMDNPVFMPDHFINYRATTTVDGKKIDILETYSKFEMEKSNFEIEKYIERSLINKLLDAIL